MKADKLSVSHTGHIQRPSSFTPLSPKRSVGNCGKLRLSWLSSWVAVLIYFLLWKGPLALCTGANDLPNSLLLGISASFQSSGTEKQRCQPPPQTLPKERPLVKSELSGWLRAGLCDSRTLSSRRWRGFSVGNVALLLSTTLSWHIMLENWREKTAKLPYVI